jgi:hypothetical protein
MVGIGIACFGFMLANIVLVPHVVFATVLTLWKRDVERSL